MSLYQFAPCPDLATKEEVYATWVNAFSDEDIKNVIQLCDSRVMGDGRVFGVDGAPPQDVRKCKTSWIELAEDSAWLYERMAMVGRNVNGQFFQFDLFGFVEHFQYTVYESGNDHYNWHVDKGSMGFASPRKLSLVLMLSDPSDYEGGDLEIEAGGGARKVPNEKGTVVAFPSYVLHRVTPVTKGIRRTLVVWISGPKFK